MLARQHCLLVLSFLSFCVSLSFLFCFSFSRCVLLFLLFVRFLMFVASLCPNFPTFRSISSFRCVVSSLFCRFVVRCVVVLSFYRCIAPQVDEQFERMYQECVPNLSKSIKKVRTASAAQKHGKHRRDWPSLALVIARLGRSDKPKGPTDA